jgi:prepilin signal peptidase PulO-like enzyme (type II secretory pathway)
MFFCLVSKATREGFGYGDSLMIMVVGFHIGLMLMLQVLMVSFAILAIFSAILMTRKIKKKGDSIPFIPFLTMGYLIVTVQFL